MKAQSRPKNIKLEVLPVPPLLRFEESARRDSLYRRKLEEAINSSGAIRIMLADKYMAHQFKAAAKKMHVKLLFADQGEFLWIKPVVVDGDVKRLILLLREPRSLMQLQGAKLELHLQNTLSQLAGDRVAHYHKEKWVLTEKGMDTL